MQLIMSNLYDCTGAYVRNFIPVYYDRLSEKKIEIRRSMNYALVVFAEDDIFSTTSAITSLIGGNYIAVVFVVLNNVPEYKRDQVKLDFDRELSKRQYTHIPISGTFSDFIEMYGMLNPERLNK